MDDVFEVFIIGPMGKDKDLESERTTPISEHIANIEVAVNEVLMERLPPASLRSVFSPLGGGADITEYVFSRIDSADMAIADISSRSPSVMYELAYFHALGTPFIILDDQKDADEGTPFYLHGANIVRVPDFEVETLKDAIGERMRMFFDQEDEQNFSLNPISQFYSAPLVEAAGAATIARGYYWNMVDAVLNTGVGVASRFDEVRDFAVVIPTDEFDVSEDLDRFASILRRFNGGKKMQEAKWEIHHAGKPRVVAAPFVNGTVYDYPRTIRSLEQSPRLLRVTQRRRIGGGTPISAERLETSRARMASRLVSFFMKVIEDTADENRVQIFRKRLRFITFEEFAAELGVTG